MSADTQTEDEAEVAMPEPVVQAKKAEPVPEQYKAAIPEGFQGATKLADPEKLDEILFKAFSLGDIKIIDSTPDHKPPTQEDTIEGRYASVLFTSASQANALYTIYEDIHFLEQMYDNSEQFRLFTQNAGVGAREIREFNKGLQ